MSDNECVWEEGIHDQTNDHWCKTHKVWSSDHPAPSPVQPDDQGATGWHRHNGGRPFRDDDCPGCPVLTGSHAAEPVHVLTPDDLAKRLREERAAGWDEGWCKAVSIFTQNVESTPNPHRAALASGRETGGE